MSQHIRQRQRRNSGLGEVEGWGEVMAGAEGLTTANPNVNMKAAYIRARSSRSFLSESSFSAASSQVTVSGGNVTRGSNSTIRPGPRDVRAVRVAAAGSGGGFPGPGACGLAVVASQIANRTGTICVVVMARSVGHSIGHWVERSRIV